MVIRFDPRNPKGIVWLASYPKSGNTWVRAFLHSLFHALRGDPDEAVDLNQLTEFSADDRAFERFRKHVGESVGSARSREIAAARVRVQEEIAAEMKGLALLKTHNAMADDHGYPMINRAVSLGAVYVVRNPLAVAISFAHFRRVPLDTAIADMATPGFGIPTGGDMIGFTMGTWSEHVLSWTERPNPAVHVVRYEDLHTQPLATFGGIARHLVLKGSEQQIRGAIEKASFDNLQKTEIEKGFKEKPNTAERFFRSGKVGEWREVLSAEQVEKIVADHGEQMGRFRYLP
jgi:hypothetical protein